MGEGEPEPARPAAPGIRSPQGAGHGGRPSRGPVGPWWDRRSVRFRRTARTLVLLLATAVVSLGLGLVTASASSPVGPHDAQWRTTLDSAAALDLGPLGSVSIDSPVAPLGVRVTLGEIPAESSNASSSESSKDATSATAALGKALSSDGAAYAGLAAHPRVVVEAGLRALLADAERRAGVIASLILCLVAAGRLATGGHLRDGVRSLASHGPASFIAGTAAVSGAVSLLVPAVDPYLGDSGSDAGADARTLSVLAGTPLAQARFSGRVADVVSAYGGQVTSWLDRSKAFYASAAANLRTAYAGATAEGGTEAVTASGALATAAATASTANASASASPSAAPGSTESPAAAVASRGTTTAVLSTDLHCNMDVMAFAGVLDEVSGAGVHMDDGDITMTGSKPESLCVDALSKAVPKGVARIATIGNHDSSDTAARLRATGWKVTDGSIQSAGRLRVLGDVDVERTTAAGTTMRGSETAAQLGSRLSRAACDAHEKGTGADVVLVHEPYTFPPLAKAGCAPLLIAGHVHAERGMTGVAGTDGDVDELVSGAAKGGTSIGPVVAESWLHVLSFDSDGRLLAWRAITLHKDASVTVGPWRSPAAVGQTVGAVAGSQTS